MGNALLCAGQGPYQFIDDAVLLRASHLDDSHLSKRHATDDHLDIEAAKQGEAACQVPMVPAILRHDDRSPTRRRRPGLR